MAAGLEIRGEPLAGVAVIHNERSVAVRLEELEQSVAVGVGGEVDASTVALTWMCRSPTSALPVSRIRRPGVPSTW